MKYQVKLTDPTERAVVIGNASAASDKHEDFDFFRDQTIPLPVVRLPIDLPVYRMENFRTFSEQGEHIARERLGEDYFKKGQEKESVQQVQHHILAKLAAKGKSDSVVPILDVLEREGQRERLLITRSGVVVNGNRRLAAMRELFALSADDYPHFSHVNCMVLPADALPRDVLEMEAILQARPETKLDYDWIGEAELLNAMLKLKGTAEAVAKRLGRKANEVKTTLQALSEADLYLKEWCKTPGEYRRVAEDGEQLFKDLPALLSGKTQQLQDASRAIAWALFDNRGRLEGRVYNYNIVIGKRAEDVLDRLADQLGLASDAGGDMGGNGDDFEFEMEGDEERGAYDEVLQALKDSDKRAEAVDALVEISTGVVESEKDKRSGHAALKAITVANAKLAEVDLTRADPKTYETIDKQLLSIANRTQKLREKITEICSASKSGS